MPRHRVTSHRLAASLTFAVLFFAGAAFSAGAGDLGDDPVDSAVESVASAPAPATEPPLSEEPGCTARMRAYEPEECVTAPAPPEPAAPAPTDRRPRWSSRSPRRSARRPRPSSRTSVRPAFAPLRRRRPPSCARTHQRACVRA